MWPFSKSKAQKEAAAAIERAVDKAANLINDLNEEHEPKAVPCLVLLFENGRSQVIEYGSVIKRNKEAAQLRMAIDECHDWCIFQNQDNRDIYVRSEGLNAVLEEELCRG